MKNHPILLIFLVSMLAAIVTVVLLKYLGIENPTAIAGGVAGGIAGGISANLLKAKK